MELRIWSNIAEPSPPSAARFFNSVRAKFSNSRTCVRPGVISPHGLHAGNADTMMQPSPCSR